MSEVRAASWDHLRASAAAWRSLGRTWESAFTEVHQSSLRPGGTDWTGAGAEAFQDRAYLDLVKIRTPVDTTDTLAGIAERGADAQDGTKSSVLDTVDEIESDNFQVGEDWSVTDRITWYSSAAELEQRELAAEGHRSYLMSKVYKLVGDEDDISRNLTTASAELHEFSFGDEGADGGAGEVDSGGPGLPPDDPQKFTQWWTHLTAAQKDAVYDRDHFIGNHPGMPFEDKNHYNMERHLPELMANAQSNVDAMQARYDQLARQVYMGDHSPETSSEVATLGPQLQAAKHSLAEYQGVQNAMNTPDGGPPRYLGYLDDQGRAAVSIGDPDTAKRNAIFVTGTGADLTRIDGATDKSQAMYAATRAADKSLQDGDVAVTTWMAYDRPMDVFEAAHTSYAHHGAAGLDSFENGMRASHIGAPSTDTVIGHSYGSTLVGAASTDGHHLAADRIIAVGSPGMLTDCASGLDLSPGAKVFATRADNDIITMATGFTLGPDPADMNFGATLLYADPGPSGFLGIPGTSIDAHSSYWDRGNPALINFGNVIAGLDPPHVLAPPPYVEKPW
jgi:hypothetical protein